MPLRIRLYSRKVLDLLLVDLPGIIKVRVFLKSEPRRRPAQGHRRAGDQDGQRLHKEPELHNRGRLKSHRRFRQLRVPETRPLDRQVRRPHNRRPHPSGPARREHQHPQGLQHPQQQALLRPHLRLPATHEEQPHHRLTMRERVGVFQEARAVPALSLEAGGEVAC